MLSWNTIISSMPTACNTTTEKVNNQHANPQAPPNAYQLFQKDPSVKSSFVSQNLSLPELSKKLAAEWKSLDEAAKKK